jgi:hypothetical protein
MKIYFAGSIRGGRDDRELYKEIVKKLEPFGTVVTEHIANEKLSSYGETHMTNEEIFSRDVAWLSGSDVVVAEVTTPSLGVGYEVATAEFLGKKTLCLYREQEGKRLSAMLSGNPKLTVEVYKSVDDLDKIFKEFFRKF